MKRGSRRRSGEPKKIRLGQTPRLLRAGHQGEKLVGPFALSFDEQLEVAPDLLGSQAAAARCSQGAAEEPRGAPLVGARRGSTC